MPTGSTQPRSTRAEPNGLSRNAKLLGAGGGAGLLLAIASVTAWIAAPSKATEERLRKVENDCTARRAENAAVQRSLTEIKTEIRELRMELRARKDR